MFAINTADPAPIWKQIEEGMRRLIALGALKPGAAVPSMRDLARDLRVNPNTVARAYQRLTEAGVLAVRRGEGTFVADRCDAVEAPVIGRRRGERFASTRNLKPAGPAAAPAPASPQRRTRARRGAIGETTCAKPIRATSLRESLRVGRPVRAERQDEQCVTS